MRKIHIILTCLSLLFIGQKLQAQTATYSGDLTQNNPPTQTIIEGTCSDCTDVTVEFTIDIEWTGGADWIHGLSVAANGPWHNVDFVGLPGTWVSVAAGCNGGGCHLGGPWGAGYYFDGSGTSSGCEGNSGASGDGNPCNNWGDSADFFTFTITADVCACDVASGSASLTINATGDGVTGGFNGSLVTGQAVIVPDLSAIDCMVNCDASFSAMDIFCNDAAFDLAPLNDGMPHNAAGWTGTLASCVTSTASCGGQETATLDPCGCQTSGTFDLTHDIGYVDDNDCTRQATQNVTFVAPIADLTAVPTDVCAGGTAPAITDVVVLRDDNSAAWDGPTVTVEGPFSDVGCGTALDVTTPMGCDPEIRDVYFNLNTGCATCDVCVGPVAVTFYPDVAAWLEDNQAGDCAVGMVTVSAVNSDVCFTQANTTACVEPDCGEPDDTQSETYDFDPGFATACNSTFSGDVTCVCTNSTPIPDPAFDCPASADQCGGLIALNPVDNAASGGDATWSGSGAVAVDGSDMFDPSGFSVGATITLTYTIDNNGCIGSVDCSFQITSSKSANAGGFTCPPPPPPAP